MKEQKITMVSVHHGLRVKYTTYDSQTHETSERYYYNSAPVHDDLLTSMRNLKPYVAMILHMDISQMELETFMRKSYGDVECVSFYLAIRNEKGRCPMNMEVRIRIGEDDFLIPEILLDDLDRCGREALLYVDKGKRYGLEQAVETAYSKAV